MKKSKCRSPLADDWVIIDYNSSLKGKGILSFATT
jgi:hypothetical protein